MTHCVRSSKHSRGSFAGTTATSASRRIAGSSRTSTARRSASGASGFLAARTPDTSTGRTCSRCWSAFRSRRRASCTCTSTSRSEPMSRRAGCGNSARPDSVGAPGGKPPGATRQESHPSGYHEARRHPPPARRARAGGAVRRALNAPDKGQGLPGVRPDRDPGQSGPPIAPTNPPPRVPPRPIVAQPTRQRSERDVGRCRDGVHPTYAPWCSRPSDVDIELLAAGCSPRWRCRRLPASPRSRAPFPTRVDGIL